MKKLLLVLLLVATPVPAGAIEWRALLPQMQAQGDPRHMPPPGGRERWDERRRLREEVREGRLPRDEAVRQYRERFPERQHGQHQERRRMSHEEREQMRRDIHEANRNLRKR